WPPYNVSIGAQSISPSYAPGIVVLRAYNEASRMYQVFGNGTLIAPDWVMTVAHLFEGVDPKLLTQRFWDQQQRELVGRLEIIEGIEDLTKLNNGKAVALEKVIIHPDYKQATQFGDIALLKLAKPTEGLTMTLSSGSAADPIGF